MTLSNFLSTLHLILQIGLSLVQLLLLALQLMQGGQRHLHITEIGHVTNSSAGKYQILTYCVVYQEVLNRVKI